VNLDIYNDAAIVKELSRSIAKEASRLDRNVKIMHICGTHENSVVRFGLRELLPENVSVIAGPGCPVCVTSARDIDAIIDLILKQNVKLLTFGDMLKVPGSRLSFAEARSLGADVDMVYSVFDALKIASNEEKPCIFFACGFETTAAPTAAALRELTVPENFFVYTVHKYTPNGVYALLKSGKISMDGLILPGHASSISGLKPYERFVDEFSIPCVSAGFEAADVLLAILMILRQINNAAPAVENAYRRVINYEGNIKALDAINSVFRLDNALWRGLGQIESSGYEFNDDYAHMDAKRNFEINYPDSYVELKHGCRCADVILGRATPLECPLFATVCTPQHPVGPCMVSDEGTCKNHYDGGYDG